VIRFLALALVLLPTHLLAAPGGGEAPLEDPERFVADLVLRPAGGPETHLFLQKGSGVVALRLFVPLAESGDEAGAAQLIARLAGSRMAAMGDRMGARTGVRRVPGGLVYEVAGPASELDFLVWVLNEGLKPPEAGRFAEVRRDQLAEVLRRQETPQGALAHRIRGAAGDPGPPLLGSAVALERMHAGIVTQLWTRSHLRGAVRLVVAGDLEPEVALASVTDLELPEASAEAHPGPGTPAGEPRPQPEIIRHWVAQAWPLDRPRDPRGLVAVALLGEQLQARGGDYELGAELWEGDGRWTLVLSGAAYPRSQQAMRTRLAGLLDEGTQAVSDPVARRLAARIRGELLLEASTPWGFAELVGHAMDAGYEATEVARVLDELESLDGPALTAFFRDLQSRTPIREELRP
jgi:hypothetical protein